MVYTKLTLLFLSALERSLQSLPFVINQYGHHVFLLLFVNTGMLKCFSYKINLNSYTTGIWFQHNLPTSIQKWMAQTSKSENVYIEKKMFYQCTYSLGLRSNIWHNRHKSILYIIKWASIYNAAPAFNNIRNFWTCLIQPRPFLIFWLLVYLFFMVQWTD